MLARLGGAALLAGLLVIPAVSQAADADECQTLDNRRLSPDQRRRLLAGETVIYAVPETTDVQLGAGVAMYLPVALARVAEMLTSPDLVLRDSSITASGPIPADATPLAQALIAANPQRILWGSDWPHPDAAPRTDRRATDLRPPLSVDDGRVLNQLAVWAPDSALRHAILVENPARLYGFEQNRS
jgi:predicted TIM-barrel fold metal-dependent hydrolase